MTRKNVKDLSYTHFFIHVEVHYYVTFAGPGTLDRCTRISISLTYMWFLDIKENASTVQTCVW